MNEQTLVVVLVFLFAVIALLALGARSFIQLVDLILSNGSKVEALVQAILHLLMLSSPEQADKLLSHLPEDMRTTLETQESDSSENTQETK